MSWLGSAITTGVSMLGGLIGNNAQKKNINRQIRAQQEENQKNRDYNLMLAQQQNAWNVEQWERENEYNSPEAITERLRKGKINPDLFYGGGAQNMSASSPMMTSGAPSTATDMSALGQKPTLGQAIQSALRDSMLGAQIDNIKANTKKTLADAGISENQLEYEDAKNLIGLDLMRQTYDKNSKEWQILGEELKQAKIQTENVQLDYLMKQIDKMLHEKKSNAIVKKLENDANMSETNANLAAKSFIYQLLGLKADSEIKQYEAQFKMVLDDESWLKDVISFIRLIKDTKK